jgi:hypothetical protein
MDSTRRIYWGAEKSLALPGRKQARKHVRDAHNFNNIETRAVNKFFFSLQDKAPKEIHIILTEILASFFPSRAKDLSAVQMYYNFVVVFMWICFSSGATESKGRPSAEL